ncbi:MAG: ketoacyl-ACP synthase III [Deltaproteobacteria bacterium]|nr:ketoacyl-ACP synthase III [Deltaproteobacteria bacterium]
MYFAARILGTGSAYPAKRITNEDVARKIAEFGIETSDQWIQDRTGIRERRVAAIENGTETNSSLGAEAARQALSMAGKTADDIDQIIYATCTPDTLIPSTACWLQQKIGAARAWSMDINAACSGFVFGIVTAEQFIRSGHARTTLVVGAEVLTQFVNWQDRTSCILFGDGAGAAVLEQVPAQTPRRLLSNHLLSNGDLNGLFLIPAGGSKLELTPERYHQNLHKIHMNGREIFKVAVRTLVECAQRTLAKNQMTIADLDWFVPHQANIRIIESVAGRLKLPMDRVLINLDRFGNTSAATIPTVLDEALRAGRIQRGQTILFDAFGAGLTAGAVLLRW